MRGAGWLAATLMLARLLKGKGREEAYVEPKVEAVIIRKTRNPYIPQPGRYSSTDWFNNLCSIPASSLLRRIKGPITCTGLMAMLVCLLHYFLAPLGRFPSLGLQAHSLLGSALGLLLVFRTNTAYARFWEGRKIWERILDAGRDLARYTVIYRRQIGDDSAARILRLVQAFPYCMIEHLRGKADRQLRQKLERLVGDLHAGIEGDLPLSTNRPLYVVNRLSATITRVPNEQGPQAMFTNRERCMMLGVVQALSKAIGQCERIVQTPVPLTYVRHTSRFLSIFMFTLPFALVSQLGAITVPVTIVASWALFGILEIGLMIEDPFQGVLKVEVVADTLERDLFETIRFLGADDLWQSLGRRGVEPLAKHSWAEASFVDPASRASGLKARADAARAPLRARPPVGSGSNVRPAAGDATLEVLHPATLGDGHAEFDELKILLQDVTRASQGFEKADAAIDGARSYAEWRSIIRAAEEYIAVSDMPCSQPLPADVHDDNAYLESKSKQVGSHDEPAEEEEEGEQQEGEEHEELVEAASG